MASAHVVRWLGFVDFIDNMTSHPLVTTGYPFPPDFAVAEYEAIHQRVSAKSKPNMGAWEQYTGAWNGLAHRFRTCAESDEAFTASIRQAGDAPPPSERYIQERELFSFFVAGLSSVESLCFALFAIGAMLRPNDFPMGTPKELRAISPESTARTFGSLYPGDAFTSALQQLTRSQEFRDWKEIRNILAHRAAPGRIIFAGITSNQQAAQWKVGISLDLNTTSSRRQWLSGQLTAVLRAVVSYIALEF